MFICFFSYFWAEEGCWSVSWSVFILNLVYIKRFFYLATKPPPHLRSTASNLLYLCVVQMLIFCIFFFFFFKLLNFLNYLNCIFHTVCLISFIYYLLGNPFWAIVVFKAARIIFKMSSLLDVLLWMIASIRNRSIQLTHNSFILHFINYLLILFHKKFFLFLMVLT